MKLYATVTSERATKGQGGKWLDIEITSETGTIGKIKVRETVDSVGEITKITAEFAEHVYVNGHHWLDAEITTKVKKCPRCGETGGRHSDDACEPIKEEWEAGCKGGDANEAYHFSAVLIGEECPYCGKVRPNEETKGKKQKGESIDTCGHPRNSGECSNCIPY